MQVREALEKNPDGLTMNELMKLTRKTFKALKASLARLPVETDGEHYYLVMNADHRAELREKLGLTPVSGSTAPASKQTKAENTPPSDVQNAEGTQNEQITLDDWSHEDGLMLDAHQILDAFFKGEALQTLGADNRWRAFNAATCTLQELMSGHRKVRKHIDSITVGGVQIAQPIALPLSAGTEYYTPNPIDDSLCDAHFWNDLPSDNVRLARGMVHTVRRFAQRHALALIAASGGTV